VTPECTDVLQTVLAPAVAARPAPLATTRAISGRGAPPTVDTTNPASAIAVAIANGPLLPQVQVVVDVGPPSDAADDHGVGQAAHKDQHD